MTTYRLSKTTARQMLNTWFSTSSSSAGSDSIPSLFGMFTVFDSSGVGSTISLKELHSDDIVRFHVTPGDFTDQEDIVPYGNILATIIDVASGPVPAQPDDLPKFIIVYE